MISMCIFLQFLSSFQCSSKSFLNFRLSSTRLLIKWFLIKNMYFSIYFADGALCLSICTITTYIITKNINSAHPMLPRYIPPLSDILIEMVQVHSSTSSLCPKV